MLTRGLSIADGIFPTVGYLQSANLKADLTVAINDGASITFYKTSIVDDGFAILLNNGLFANPTNGGGDMLPRLAPDLTWPSLGAGGGVQYTSITGIDASSLLTTILSLSGKFYVGYIALADLTAQINNIKLTIDGVVIWDTSYTSSVSHQLIGSAESIGGGVGGGITCNSSFLLEYKTATDTNITINYMAVPIL